MVDVWHIVGLQEEMGAVISDLPFALERSDLSLFCQILSPGCYWRNSYWGAGDKSHGACGSKSCAWTAMTGTPKEQSRQWCSRAEGEEGLSGSLALEGVSGTSPTILRIPAGLGDVFSECDTRWPTEDSKYIFYDPGRLSPVTFSRREAGRWRGTSHVSVIWILFGLAAAASAMDLGVPEKG